MKKVFTLCLALVMLTVMSSSICAAVGGFVQSPSNNPAPEIIGGDNESEDCPAEIIITPYIERDDLPEDVRENIEDAYEQIKENPDLSKLVEELEEITKELGIDVADLAVSDLFNISCTDCDAHEGHGHFDITLKADTLYNFVCLLQYVNGEWIVVSGAEVTNNGTHLEFNSNGVGAFAIVVNANWQSADAPKTGDNSAFLITAAMVSGLALIVLAVEYKKSRA